MSLFSHVYWPLLYVIFAHFSIGLFLFNCECHLYVKDTGSLSLVSFRSFIPVFVFLFIFFMALHFLGFTAFLERPSYLAGTTPDSGMCSLLVAKSPVLASFLRPSTLALPSCVPLSGWLAVWGQKPTEAGSSRLQVEREKLPAFSNRGGSFFSLIFHLFLSFLPVFFCLSLCRCLLSASCLPHPKSCAKPFTS